MKSAFVAALLAGVAAAQNVAIGAPPPNSTFSPGNQFVVQVNKPVRRFFHISFSHFVVQDLKANRRTAATGLPHQFARRLGRDWPPILCWTGTRWHLRRHRPHPGAGHSALRRAVRPPGCNAREHDARAELHRHNPERLPVRTCAPICSSLRPRRGMYLCKVFVRRNSFEWLTRRSSSHPSMIRARRSSSSRCGRR